MKKITKKILCITLVTIIVLSSSAFVPMMSSANREKEAREVSYKVAALCRKYDDYESLGKQLEENGEDCIKIATRLIVNGDKDDISTDSSIESVCSDRFTVLQYDSEEKAKQAYESFKNKGVSVTYDLYMKALQGKESMNVSDWGTQRIETNAVLDYFYLKIKSSVTVAVADSGVNYNHEIFGTLGTRISRTKYNISASGAENDEMDDDGHGTATAGLIAGCTPSNVKLKCYKISSSSGSTLTALVTFYNYLLEMKSKPEILNCSFGTENWKLDDDAIKLLDQLVNALMDSGVAVVVSAGNSSREAADVSPACIERALTVSASGWNNEKTSFTNHGAGIDITAPGDFITAPHIVPDKYSTKDTMYKQMSGTSFSAPYCAAGAAIVLMQNKKLTPDQVFDELKQKAIPIQNPDEIDFDGAGLLNLYNLIDDKRVSDVEFSIDEGYYNDGEQLSIELSCSDKNTKIMYTTDYSIPTLENGTEYTEPIIVDKNTRIIAFAYSTSSISTKLHSFYASKLYQFKESNEEDYEIDENGVITNYTGTATAIVVPQTIKGITPTAIGEEAFVNSYSTNTKNWIRYVELPDSIKEIGRRAFSGKDIEYIKGEGVENIEWRAFENCDMLKEEYMPNVKHLEGRVFEKCRSLTDVSFRENLEYSDGDFCYSALESADFPHLKEAYCSFNYCPIVTADLPELEHSTSFSNCTKLTEVNLPKMKEVGSRTFYGCTSLTGDIVLPEVTIVEQQGFTESYFHSISIPKCETVESKGFYNCHAVNIDLPLAKTVGRDSFQCRELETLNLENVEDNLYKPICFSECYNLKNLCLPKVKNFPDMYGNDVTEWNMEGIYVPNAEYSNYQDLTKFPNLKYIYMPNLSMLDAYFNDSAIFIELFFGKNTAFDDINQLNKRNLRVIIPESNPNAGTIQGLGCTYIPSDYCTYTKTMADGCVYQCSYNKEVVALPSHILKHMWNTDIINQQTKDAPYNFLLDFNNDKYLNAKDFVTITRLTNS